MERDLFFWIVIGMVAGVAARLVFPVRDPGGFILTLLLGIAGALAGGVLALQIGSGAPSASASLVSAAIGAVTILTLYRVVIRARTG